MMGEAATGSAEPVGSTKLLDLVTRELRGLARAGASPWAHLVGDGPQCFGCGERGRCAIVRPSTPCSRPTPRSHWHARGAAVPRQRRLPGAHASRLHWA